MTPEQKNIECAKLDGWIPYSPGDFNPTPRWINSCYTVRTVDEFLHYGYSYDAIIPLIQKFLVKDDKMLADDAEKFWDSLNDITDFFETGGHTHMLMSTPSQLQDALLRAHGFEV